VSDGCAVQTRTLDVFDPAGASEWDALVQQHPEAAVFHTAAWARVVHDSYGHSPLYLCFHSAGKPVALVPLIEILSPLTGRRGVGVPFSDACGPLLFSDNPDLVRHPLAELARRRNWRHIELRGEELIEESEPAATFYGHILPLMSEPDQLFARFGNGTRGAVKQALKNNLEVEISQELKAVEEFYRLQIETRKKHGVPPQPFRFFANIHKNLIKPGYGFTVIVRSGGQTAAGAIFLRNARRAIYKFAASVPALAKTRANNLVLWEGIRHLQAAGCEYLDFGRTSLDHEGLRHFKLSWGAEEHMIRYCRFETAQGRWCAGSHRNGDGIHQRIFRNLPLALNRLAGAILYPHLD
jgi:lipid II:glycine glycyltransferase (peptidoglycan interpeptide bridge formation enzyme)